MSAAEALAPEQSVDEVRESLSVTEKGQPANTIGNCRTVFCHDPLLRDAIRLNLLTDRVDIVRNLGWRRNTSALTDTDVKYLLLYFEQNYGLTSEKKMTAALSIVANENCYHPIQDVLNGLVWDGTPRIRSCLHHFLGAEDVYKRQHLHLQRQFEAQAGGVQPEISAAVPVGAQHARGQRNLYIGQVPAVNPAHPALQRGTESRRQCLRQRAWLSGGNGRRKNRLKSGRLRQKCRVCTRRFDRQSPQAYSVSTSRR